LIGAGASEAASAAEDDITPSSAANANRAASGEKVVFMVIASGVTYGFEVHHIPSSVLSLRAKSRASLGALLNAPRASRGHPAIAAWRIPFVDFDASSHRRRMAHGALLSSTHQNTNNKESPMKIVARSLIAAAAIVCCAAQARSPAPAAAMASEQLAVGARPYQVQVHSRGSGRYTVIFESGFGADLRAWRKVVPEVAKVARTLAYSRAGHGASEARPEPRTIVQNTDELEQLIAAAKAAPPFILVGHSYGGLLMRAFAARHPQQVAGMVLVDPADERFNPALRALDAARAAEDDRQFATFIPPKFQPEYKLLQPMLDSGELALEGKLPDVPTVVLTSVRQGEKPVFFLETAPAVAIKRELHADFLRQFTHGSQVVTANSGHTIQLDEPELVVAAITKVIGVADTQSAQAGR
jgi:pimeloyl-ACP methyl ester carboxylesterase